MIAEKFGLPSASTGALLREQRVRGTALGREADTWTAQGRLFPDEIAMRVLGEWLDERGTDAFLLDGFPRTLGQAAAFDAQMNSQGTPIEAVFHLALGDDAIRERVAGRVTCPHCGASFSAERDGMTDGDACPDCGKTLVRRRDDTPNALEERLEQHRMHTGPVIAFYREADRLTDIDASIGRDAVFQKLCAVIEGKAVPA